MSLFNSKERMFQEWIDMGCVLVAVSSRRVLDLIITVSQHTRGIQIREAVGLRRSKPCRVRGRMSAAHDYEFMSDKLRTSFQHRLNSSVELIRCARRDSAIWPSSRSHMINSFEAFALRCYLLYIQSTCFSASRTHNRSSDRYTLRRNVRASVSPPPI